MSAGRVQGGLRGLPVLPSGGGDRSSHSASCPLGTSLWGQHHRGRWETTFPMSSVSVAAKLGPPWPGQHPALLPRPGSQARPAALGHFCPHFIRHQADTRAGPWSRAAPTGRHAHARAAEQQMCALTRLFCPSPGGGGPSPGRGQGCSFQARGRTCCCPHLASRRLFSPCVFMQLPPPRSVSSSPLLPSTPVTWD